MQRFLLLVTYFVGMSALVLAGILGYEGFREARRLNAEITSLKAAIEQVAGSSTKLQPIAEQSASEAELIALRNRLAILEEAWRQQSPGSASLPPLQPAATAAAAAATSDGNCIPQDIGFLATPGETFPICGTAAKVTLSAIGPSDIVLDSGGTAPVGGKTGLAGSDCAVTVISADAANGFAELRVSCG